MLGLDGDPSIWVRMAPFSLPRFLLSNSVCLCACVGIYICMKTLACTRIFMCAWMWKHTHPLPSPCTESAASPPGGSQAAISCSVWLWAGGDGHLHHPGSQAQGPADSTKAPSSWFRACRSGPALPCGAMCLHAALLSLGAGRKDRFRSMFAEKHATLITGLELIVGRI